MNLTAEHAENAAERLLSIRSPSVLCDLPGYSRVSIAAETARAEFLGNPFPYGRGFSRE